MSALFASPWEISRATSMGDVIHFFPSLTAPSGIVILHHKYSHQIIRTPATRPSPLSAPHSHHHFMKSLNPKPLPAMPTATHLMGSPPFARNASACSFCSFSNNSTRFLMTVSAIPLTSAGLLRAMELIFSSIARRPCQRRQLLRHGEGKGWIALPRMAIAEAMESRGLAAKRASHISKTELGFQGFRVWKCVPEPFDAAFHRNQCGKDEKGSGNFLFTTSSGFE